MAQTMSEFEKERAELLKAIESQAQQMSGKKTDEPVEHTLNDWLNAAEEVMPSQPKPRQPNKRPAPRTSTPASPPPTKNTKASKASFFGVIIMLTLLLTILGVLFIAYTSINKELKKVMESSEASMKEFKSLKTSVAELEKSIASGGQGQLFDKLQAKVDQLEQEIETLKTQQQSVASQVTSTQDSTTPSNASESVTENTAGNWVTEQQLDQKLNDATQKINQKLELILKHLAAETPNAKQSNVTPEKAPEDIKPQPKVAIQPAAEEMEKPVIQVPEKPKTNVAQQPVIKLVVPAKVAEKPEVPNTPLQNYSPEVVWLMQEPALNFTLQLASMPERYSVQKIKDQKQLSNAKIIPQDRNGQTQYILISGSFASRAEADKMARSYQSRLKISPWVRKIKDLTAKVK